MMNSSRIEQKSNVSHQFNHRRQNCQSSPRRHSGQSSHHRQGNGQGHTN